MVRRGTDQGMVQKVTSGEYVIDEHAVAEAMLNRMARGELPRSAMRVAGEPLDERAVGTGENGAAAARPRLP
jgi:hypothetical protein